VGEEICGAKVGDVSEMAKSNILGKPRNYKKV